MAYFVQQHTREIGIRLAIADCLIPAQHAAALDPADVSDPAE